MHRDSTSVPSHVVGLGDTSVHPPIRIIYESLFSSQVACPSQPSEVKAGPQACRCICSHISLQLLNETCAVESNIVEDADTDSLFKQHWPIETQFRSEVRLHASSMKIC